MTLAPCPKPGKKPKKAKNPPIDKAAILAKRYGEGYQLWKLPCICGCGNEGHDLHHAFIGRKKGCLVLDDERNLVLVNHNEHIAKKFDTRKWKIEFWRKHKIRFGEAAMLEWVNSLPPKMRSRIDWL